MSPTRAARSADGLEICYEAAGRSRRTGEPSLVLIHGWALDRHLWDDEVRRLAARHHVLRLDLAGHGESGKRRQQWTMQAFAEDVKAVLDACAVAKAVLIAHSMGGPVAVETARLVPDKVAGIVLIDTLLDVEQRTPPEEIDAMAKRLQADYPGTTTYMANEYLFASNTPPAVRERVLKHATAMMPAMSIALLREAWSYDPRPALRALRTPIRAVNADKFPTNVEGNRSYMPGFDAMVVPNTAHYLMLEDPKGFGAALDRALAQVLAS